MSESENNPPNLGESVDLLGLLPEQYQSKLQSELTLHWNEIAAFSYESYRQQGRGLLLLSISSLSAKLEKDYIGWNYLKSNWKQIMQGESLTIANSIDLHVPTYVPDLEMAVLLNYGAQDDALFMKITRANMSYFDQPENSVIPVVQGHRLLSPKEAYVSLS